MGLSSTAFASKRKYTREEGIRTPRGIIHTSNTVVDKEIAGLSAREPLSYGSRRHTEERSFPPPQPIRFPFPRPFGYFPPPLDTVTLVPIRTRRS